MKKIIQIIFFFSILAVNGIAQQVSVGFQTGTGTYSMKGLKEINEIVKQDLPFDTKIVANFPPFLNYGSVIMISTSKANYGLMYTFQSTGSRISGKDYSGEYRFDMKINSSSPAIYEEVNIGTAGIIKCYIYSATGLLFSNLQMDEYLNVFDDEVINETSKFKSLNFFLESGLKFTCPVKFLDIGINAGYLLQVGKKSFHSVDNKNNILGNPINGEPVKPGWDGFRGGLSVFYTF
jgi:hypothetical protein